MSLINEKKIRGLLHEKKYEEASQLMSICHPQEVAEFLSKLPVERSTLIFRFLKRDYASDVFSYMGTRQQNSLIKSLGSNRTKDLLASLSPDDRTELFEELPAPVTKKLLLLLSKQDLAEAKELLGYPAGSVGREMTPDYVAIKPDWSARKALSHIRKVAKESETINSLYVLDDNERLLGSLTIKHLILSSPKKKIHDLMECPVFISAFADREEAVKLIKKYDRMALPVIDSHGLMLGIVTIDDLIDISDEEATEDFYKFAGISQGQDEEQSQDDLLNTSVLFLYKKRIWWLLLLLVINIFSGAIISNYEHMISTVVALVFFLPLLVDCGGNTGAQSATIMVRSLATGQVKLTDWFPLLKREILVALALGITMGLGVSILGLFRGGMEIALIVSLSMLLIVVGSSLVGMSLPFILSKFKKDPATASAPLVTSIADILGIAIYLTIAKFVLGM
jgi:magnesium transporter